MIDHCLEDIVVDRRNLPVVSYANPNDPLIRRLSISAIEKLCGQPKIKRLYHEYHLHGDKTRPFWSEALQWLGVSLEFDQRDLLPIPSQGPLVVVANHPFGIIDGLSLCDLLGQVRPDFKLMAHEVLYRAPEARRILLPVAFADSREAKKNNIDTCRKAIRHVQDGGALIVFPAGAVSTAQRVFDKAVDAEWKPFAARLIQSSQATVVPVFFEGQNSWRFHAASKLGEWIREAMLMNEVVRRIGSQVRLQIGTPLPFDSLRRYDSAAAMLGALRDITYSLDTGPTPAQALN